MPPSFTFYSNRLRTGAPPDEPQRLRRPAFPPGGRNKEVTMGQGGAAGHGSRIARVLNWAYARLDRVVIGRLVWTLLKHCLH